MRTSAHTRPSHLIKNTHTPFLSLSLSSTFPTCLSTMADSRYSSAATRRPNAAATFLQSLRQHVPNSSQLAGIATLVISGGILLLLTGLTLTAAVLALIFFLPLILISSPIWIPIAVFVFVAIAGTLSFLGFAVSAYAAGSWVYRYFRGMHPVGSGRVDYARTRIADTAGHVKDYAREYGGYFQGKVKDAAPGA